MVLKDDLYSGRGEYLVGCLDIVGFKYLLNKYRIDIMKNSLTRILSDFKEALIKGLSNDSIAFYTSDGNLYQEFPINPKIREILEKGFFNFADTLYFYIKLNENNRENLEFFENLCVIMNLYISYSILYPQNNDISSLPFRGSISIGEAEVDPEERIFIGQPFIRSYYLAESLDWMGGVIDQIIDEKWIKSLCGYNNHIIESSIPFKEKCMGLNLGLKYALNWTFTHPYINSIEEYGVSRPIYSDLEFHLRKHDWGYEENKKKNTLKLVENVDKEWNKSYPKLNK